LLGRELTPSAIEHACEALLSEARPIDDIRSNAQYRKRVAANLLEEFLRGLQMEGPRG
jgi:CO/xanthine dehydrogenase FAD-binding subunit